MSLSSRTLLSTRVGNELGAARPKSARMVVGAALTVTPLLWAVIAAGLVEPHTQVGSGRPQPTQS